MSYTPELRKSLDPKPVAGVRFGYAERVSRPLPRAFGLNKMSFLERTKCRKRAHAHKTLGFLQGPYASLKRSSSQVG